MSESSSTRLPANVPELDPRSVRLLWVNDWYDTPAEAVIEHEGVHCLLRLEAPEALGGERSLRWIVYGLGPSERAELERVHELFASRVGTHWCFHGEKHAEPTGTNPDAFYAAHRGRPPVDVSTLAPIGWLAALPLG